MPKIKKYRLTQHEPEVIETRLNAISTLYDFPKSLELGDDITEVFLTITRERDGVVTHKDLYINVDSMYLPIELLSDLGTGSFRFDFSALSTESAGRLVTIILKIKG